MIRQINLVDYRNKVLNEQIHKNGIFTDIDSNYIYFVLNISGTNIVIKNSTGTIIRTVTSAVDFNFGLRIDDGIDISGTNPSITYIKVKK